MARKTVIPSAHNATLRAQRAGSTAFFQPKLTINQPNDPYEQEADAVAEKVMRMPAPKAEPAFFQPSPVIVSPVQRKCAACEEEEKQKKQEEDTDAAPQKPEKEFDIQRKCEACAHEKKIQPKSAISMIQREEGAGGNNAGEATTEPAPFRLSPLFNPQPNPSFIRQPDNLLVPQSGSPEIPGLNYLPVMEGLNRRGVPFASTLADDANAEYMRQYEWYKSLGIGNVAKNLAGKSALFKAILPDDIGTNPDASLANWTTPMATDAAVSADYPFQWENDARNTKVFNLKTLTHDWLGRKVARKCADCEKEEIHRQEAGTGSTPDVTDSVEQTLQLSGQPMSSSVLNFMEERFGADFSNVQIHNDAQANASAEEINALAYTHENHIAFAEGQYQPDTEEGRTLLAHELTHVLQQTGTVQRVPKDGDPTCEIGHQEFAGFNLNPPEKMSFPSGKEVTHVYGYWVTWHAGDTIQDVQKSSFPKWLKWRYKNEIPKDKQDKMLEFFIRESVPLQKESALKDGCQYQILFADYLYVYFNIQSGENTNVGDGSGSVGKGGKGDGTKPLSNPLAGLKKEDKEKLMSLIKQIAGDLVKDDSKAPPEFPLSSNDIRALLQLADDPQRDKIVEFLKAKTGNGVSSVKSIEELIAIAKIKDIFNRFDKETEKGGERMAPIVNRPVQGNIVQSDPLIVPNKTVSFGFEVKNNVDALRVPWIKIFWFSHTDPLQNDAQSPAPAGWKDDNWNRYIPIDPEGAMNNKHYKVEFPAEGIYTIEAVVDHNFFLPNSFRTSVKVVDEKKALKEKEDKLYKGFLGEGVAEKTDFGQLTYGEGTITRGKIDPAFAGTTVQKQLEIIDKEIERINLVIEQYKKAGTTGGAGMVEWGEKYLEKLKKNRKDVEDYAAGKGVHIIPCSGTYISRTLGVRSMDLKLTCFISKVPPPPPSSEFDIPDTNDWYKVSVFDYTQLYENDNYNFTATSATAEGAMKAVFSTMSEEYPDGQISVAFQKWDEAGEKLTGEYVKYNRVTDTISNKIKKVVFSAPVGIAVNIISAILMVFPPTSAIGLTIGLVYNTAATFSEVMDMADKGTLTLTKGALAAGSVMLDIIPIVGNVGKAAKVVRMGTKAYYVIEGVQLAGQAILLYENGLEQIERLRTDYFLKIAEIDEQIAERTAMNPSDPEIDKLNKEKEALIKKGQSAAADTFTSMFAEQGLFIVGGKMLHGLGEHLSTASKLKERAKIADGLTGVSKLTEGERLSIADRAYNGEVEIRASKETGWKKEGEKYVLEIADDATHAQISDLLDKNPNPKPVAEPHLNDPLPEEAGEKKSTADEPATKQPVGEPKEKKTSPVVEDGEPFITATKETHEHRIHEDGTITRCSDFCTILSADAKARAGQVKGVFGKEHPNTKKAQELAEQAKALEKEAKKAAKIKDETQRDAKEKEILGKAKQLELDMATLENGMGAELDARVSASLTAIDDFLLKYPEQKGRFQERIDNRRQRRAEIAPKLNDPDPVIRKKALEDMRKLEQSTVDLRKEIPKFIENLAKPDISQRYVYDDTQTNSRGDYIKSAKGELGVPGEVMKHRDESAQGRVSGGTGDDAGHLIANTFGGAGGEQNLGRQNWIANEFGTWRKLEIEWARKLLAGVKINVEIRELSRKKGERPYMRTVSWTEIDAAGNKTNHSLTFGNFETARSRAATGAAPTPGVPEGGGYVFIWNEERSKRGLAPVYSEEDINKVLKGLGTEAANENVVFDPANNNMYDE